MPTQEQLVEALKNLPEDVKSKLKSASEEQRKAFVDNISSQLSQVSARTEISQKRDGGIISKVKSGLDALGNDAVQTTLGFAEGFTAGIPRNIAESINPELDIPRGNLKGQIAGMVVGPGKLANVVGKGVAKKIIPSAFKTAGRLATAKSAQAIGSMVPEGIKAGLVEGGVSGAIGGLALPQDEFDLAKRGYSALIGSVIGAPVGAMLGGVSGFLKAKQLAKSAKKVVEKLDKINSRQPFERPTAGDIFPVKDPKAYEQAEKIKLDELKTEMTNLLAQDVDEAENVVKNVVPKWERMNYEKFGSGLDEIASDMEKSGKNIKVTQLSDELNTYLKKRGLLGTEKPYDQIATSNTDRAIIKWAKDLNKYREEYGDASLGLKDVRQRMLAIKGTVPSKVLVGKAPMTPEVGGGREMDRILTNLLDDGSNAKLSSLKSDYAEFADMRDFARAKFDIASDYLPKEGQGMLQKFAKNSGASMVDLTLDRGTVQKLNQLEKEVGVPFLSKLRKYGSNFDELENNVRLLKEKAARTGVVVDAIETRNQEAIRGVLEKLKIPETLVRQLATAAYAWVLSKTLSSSLKKMQGES